MALKTASNLKSGQGIVKIFNFADIDNADTFVGPKSPKSYIVVNKTDNVVVSATESAGTYTFSVAGAGTDKVVDLIVVA
jgi:hypothetical protein